MILFSMAKMEYPTLQLDMLLPYAALVAISWFVSTEQCGYALMAGTLFFGFRVAMWLGAVMVQLKEKLQIYAFTLRKRGCEADKSATVGGAPAKTSAKAAVRPGAKRAASPAPKAEQDAGGQDQKKKA